MHSCIHVYLCVARFVCISTKCFFPYNFLHTPQEYYVRTYFCTNHRLICSVNDLHEMCDCVHLICLRWQWTPFTCVMSIVMCCVFVACLWYTNTILPYPSCSYTVIGNNSAYAGLNASENRVSQLLQCLRTYLGTHIYSAS